jgi:hypothetical protein
MCKRLSYYVPAYFGKSEGRLRSVIPIPCTGALPIPRPLSLVTAGKTTSGFALFYQPFMRSSLVVFSLVCQ